MALTPDDELIWTIEEFCDDHQSSKNDDNADYVLNVETFHNWCDATGNEDAKADVPTNRRLQELIVRTAFPELAVEVPVV